MPCEVWAGFFLPNLSPATVTCLLQLPSGREGAEGHTKGGGNDEAQDQESPHCVTAPAPAKCTRERTQCIAVLLINPAQ